MSKGKRTIVQYSLPESTQLLTFTGEASQISQVDPDMTGFIFAPFDLSRYPVWFIDIDFDNPHRSKPLPLQKVKHHVSDKKAYLSLALKAIESIKHENLDKVVLSRVLEKEALSVSDMSRFTEALKLRYPDAFVYCIQIENECTWIGATPERLIRYKEGMIEVDALAGTLPYSENPNWSMKEEEEQRIVTQYVEDVLSKSGVQNIMVDGPSNKRAGQMVHLHSTIRGTIDRKKLPDVIDQLHPTPAVCGAPRKTALNFIRENESHDRRYYTGYLGPIGKSDLDLFVNLRCMEVGRDHSYIFAGGGITDKSDPEKEWKELEMKSETLGRVLHNLHYI